MEISFVVPMNWGFFLSLSVHIFHVFSSLYFLFIYFGTRDEQMNGEIVGWRQEFYVFV